MSFGRGRISRRMCAAVFGYAVGLVGLIPGAAAAQETHVLVVAGLGGEQAYRDAFMARGTALSIAAGAAGIPEDHVIFLAEDPSVDPELVRARSTGEEIERAFEEIGARAGPSDRVLIILIGHGGSAGGGDSYVSLPGPDLRASDYLRLIEGLAPRTVALVNMASSSGDFVPVLAGEGRIVVTATRSVQQRNAPLFGQFFTRAFAGIGSDLDRDGRVSILEAFEFARLETERYYRDRGLLQPETALIEDRPQGTGVHLPEDDESVGFLASRFFLQGAGPRIVPDDPDLAEELAELYARQEALEVQVAELERGRDTLDPDAYMDSLEPLLLELAQVGARIRSVESGVQGGDQGGVAR